VKGLALYNFLWRPRNPKFLKVEHNSESVLTSSVENDRGSKQMVVVQPLGARLIGPLKTRDLEHAQKLFKQFPVGSESPIEVVFMSPNHLISHLQSAVTERRL